MPIQVLCSGCKTRFAVHEKFAGKQGPCPKCKAIIKIPDAPIDEEDIKVHEPEAYAGGGKTATGQPTGKPLTRKEAKITPLMLAGGAAATAAVVAAAWFLGESIREQTAIVGVALAAITFPLCVFFYAILRNDELEPFRGASLWIRTAACTAGYVGLWGAYYLAAMYLTDAGPYAWAFIALPFLAVGTGIAYGCYELAIENAAFHYAFYLVVTIVLRWLIGLPPVWSPGG